MCTSITIPPNHITRTFDQHYGEFENVSGYNSNGNSLLTQFYFKNPRDSRMIRIGINSAEFKVADNISTINVKIGSQCIRDGCDTFIFKRQDDKFLLVSSEKIVVGYACARNFVDYEVRCYDNNMVENSGISWNICWNIETSIIPDYNTI